MVPAAEGIPLPSLVQSFALYRPSFLFSSSIPTSFWTWSLGVGLPNHKALPLILKQLTFGHFDLNKPHRFSLAPSSQECRVLQENYKTIPGGRILSPCFLLFRGPQQLLKSIWNTRYFLLHGLICDVLPGQMLAPPPSRSAVFPGQSQASPSCQGANATSCELLQHHISFQTPPPDRFCSFICPVELDLYRYAFLNTRATQTRIGKETKERARMLSLNQSDSSLKMGSVQQLRETGNIIQLGATIFMKMELVIAT